MPPSKYILASSNPNRNQHMISMSTGHTVMLGGWVRVHVHVCVPTFSSRKNGVGNQTIKQTSKGNGLCCLGRDGVDPKLGHESFNHTEESHPFEEVGINHLAKPARARWASTGETHPGKDQGKEHAMGLSEGQGVGNDCKCTATHLPAASGAHSS
jgi:hypothetical protein